MKNLTCRYLKVPKFLLTNFRHNLSIVVIDDPNGIEEISELLLRKDFRVFINKLDAYAI
jgi:hypothetical protein